MALLRRVLYIDALLSALLGAGLVAVPGVVLDILGQPPTGPAWLRLLGINALGLALLEVLVAQRIEELWFWTWAFVVVAAGTAAVATLHATFGLTGGEAAWPWWTLALVAWAIAGGMLWGIGRAGTEAGPD